MTSTNATANAIISDKNVDKSDIIKSKLQEIDDKILNPNIERLLRMLQPIMDIAHSSGMLPRVFCK